MFSRHDFGKRCVFSSVSVHSIYLSGSKVARRRKEYLSWSDFFLEFIEDSECFLRRGFAYLGRLCLFGSLPFFVSGAFA